MPAGLKHGIDLRADYTWCIEFFVRSYGREDQRFWSLDQLAKGFGKRDGTSSPNFSGRTRPKNLRFTFPCVRI